MSNSPRKSTSLTFKSKTSLLGISSCTCDENQQALLKDPLHVPVRPITRARSQKIKETLNELIQEILGDSKMRHFKLGPKEDESVINLIQAIDGYNFLSNGVD